MSKRKIIVQSYYFPPVQAIGCVRNYNVTKQLSEGSDVIVNTSNHGSGIAASVAFPLQGMNINRIFTLDGFNLKSKLHKSSGKVSTKKSGYGKSLMSRILNSFPANLLVWEGGIFYILLSLLKMMKEKPNFIYSSYSPMSDHYICYLYALINRKVRWIADFRDHHLDPDVENVILRRFHFWLEKRILRRSECITTVSEGLASHFTAYNDNVLVIRNGISNDSELNKKFIKTKTFNLTYTGMLYAGRRDPSCIFQALRSLIDEGEIDLDHLQLVYAGKEGALWAKFAEQFALKEQIIDHGFVDYQTSLNIQNESSINLLLSWATKNQKGILTGKFYEYLIANKPILLAINGEIDIEFESILRDLNAGIVTYGNEEESIKSYILNNYRFWKANKYVLGEINEEELEKYRWRNLVKPILSRID